MIGSSAGGMIKNAAVTKVARELLTQIVPIKKPTFERCYIIYQLYYCGVARDKDNIWASVVKITNDALQWIGVIPEDNEKTVESVVRPQIRVKRRKDVRVEISLISYPSDVVFNTFIERMVGSNSLNTARSKSQKIKVVFHRRAKK